MKRKIIVEKYKTWDYVDDRGFFIWLDKYGEIIKKQDANGCAEVCWTHKMDSDLEAFYGIDVESQLIAILSEHISQEIDREILKDLIHLKTESDFYIETNTLGINTLFQKIGCVDNIKTNVT